MSVHRFQFRSMNTDIDLLVAGDGGPPPFDALLNTQLLFAQQEARFSRFLPDSLVSRLNRGETIDDAHLAQVCGVAFQAWEFTGGRFNPLVLRALSDSGYDRSFELIDGGKPRAQDVPPPTERIHIAGTRVSLRDAGLDLGGIVKGWTVDLAVEQLHERYPNVFLNAGGDIRCAGDEPGHAGWSAIVARPDGRGDAWAGDLQGAMATSSTLRRRWTASGAAAHHLIDPSKGLPADSGIAQATVWADECWRAECWAKAIVIGGAEALEECLATGLRARAEPSR
jgi:thiamine biosynthesis lipoprotein